MVDMDKIKIKLIVRPIDKDFTIKKYASEAIGHMLKKNKNKNKNNKNNVGDYIK
jgi:hypothetical protein